MERWRSTRARNYQKRHQVPLNQESQHQRDNCHRKLHLLLLIRRRWGLTSLIKEMWVEKLIRQKVYEVKYLIKSGIQIFSIFNMLLFQVSLEALRLGAESCSEKVLIDKLSIKKEMGSTMGELIQSKSLDEQITSSIHFQPIQQQSNVEWLIETNLCLFPNKHHTKFSWANIFLCCYFWIFI